MSNPHLGHRRIAIILKNSGHFVNRKRVHRLMKKMDLKALYCEKSQGKNYKYPYLLKDLNITKANQVWAADITHIKIPRGYVNLCALIDIHSRFIISWNLSAGMHVNFCIEMLESAFTKYPPPEIINSDRGSQFTSHSWIKYLSTNKVRASICGKGRWADNIIMERFWRTLKQEQIYIYPPRTITELRTQISKFIDFYNNTRPHKSLNYQTPASLYFKKDL